MNRSTTVIQVGRVWGWLALAALGGAWTSINSASLTKIH